MHQPWKNFKRQDTATLYSRHESEQPAELVERVIYVYDGWMTQEELRFAKPVAVRRIRWDGERIVDVTDEVGDGLDVGER